LKAGLKESGFKETDYVLDIESLDSKRFSLEVRAAQFEQALRYKLGQLPPYDVVVTADDSALNFAKTRQEELFKGSPIVFLGVNSLTLALAQNKNPNIVGVVEERSVGETLALASRLFPKDGRVHVIYDDTPTGRINHRQLKNLLKNRPELDVEWHSLRDLTYEQLFDRMKNLPPTTPLFLSTFTRDAAGRHLDSRDFMTRLKAVYRGPIFTVQQNAIGKGALGGKIVSHFAQGHAAASLAAQILNGVANDTLHVIMQSPNVFMFDHEETIRLGIDPKKLPPDAQIVGAPQSIVGQYLYLIVGAVILIALQTVFILLLVLNMRRRRSAEALLRESDARFRTFFDNSPSVMYVKDRNHVLTYVNAQYLTQYGVTREDVLGKKGGTKLTPAQKSRVEEMDRSVMDQEITVTDTVAMTGQNGELRQFYMTKFPVYGAEGSVTGIGGINTDVTELHEREQELREAKAEAEKAAEEADAANKSKSTFLATMSHEIRTPMNGVLGTADLLSRTDLSENQREFVDIMKESGNALLDLLNDILDLSKIEAGSVELEETDFSVSELLHATNNLWAHQATEKGLGFSVENEIAGGDHILSDRNRLRQVINNLVGNAVKFTEKGTVTVNASESVIDGDTVQLRFSITDTGIGITDEQKEKIFQPFTQADSSTTRNFGGTGLGLSICKNLTELLGGAIGVDSTPGQGSTFWFTITAKRGASKNTEQTLAESAASQVDPQDHRTLHVLVAEDNKLNQQIITWMLAPLACQFDVVQNGREAVAAATRSQYDLVLMDVQMPVMDGVAATKQIRALEGPNQNIPIIALTANAMRGDREKYLKDGLSDYVSKPIDQRELLKTIARCVGVPMPTMDEPANLGSTADPATEGNTQNPADSKEFGNLMTDLDDLLDGTKG
jgi:PAS domain S-box-containing protein